jgi:hypothetical protein
LFLLAGIVSFDAASACGQLETYSGATVDDGGGIRDATVDGGGSHTPLPIRDATIGTGADVAPSPDVSLADATCAMACMPADSQCADGGVTTCFAVASAIDVNGDGYSDVIVGAPGWVDSPGAVLVYLGSAHGLGAAPSLVLGNSSAEDFGSAVVSAGDIDGDGYADLAISGNIDGPGLRTGAVFVYLGGAAGPASTPVVTLVGASPYVSFGATLAGAGDVNRDGFADLVVGAPAISDGIVGAAYVYLGESEGLSSPAQTLTDPAMDAWGEFGFCVASREADDALRDPSARLGLLGPPG